MNEQTFLSSSMSTPEKKAEMFVMKKENIIVFLMGEIMCKKGWLGVEFK